MAITVEQIQNAKRGDFIIDSTGGRWDVLKNEKPGWQRLTLKLIEQGGWRRLVLARSGYGSSCQGKRPKCGR